VKVVGVWVFFRELLVSFEGNFISSYFDKLLEVKTVGVPDIPLLRKWDSSKLLSALSEGHVSIGMHIFTVLCPFSPVARTNPTYVGSGES
jgi:hypothetical protein